MPANTISTLPAYEARSFALWVAKATEKYFEDPDVKRRFEAWKKEREAKALSGKSDVSGHG